LCSQTTHKPKILNLHDSKEKFGEEEPKEGGGMVKRITKKEHDHGESWRMIREALAFLTKTMGNGDISPI
jgi:hypothetical protein